MISCTQSRLSIKLLWKALSMWLELGSPFAWFLILSAKFQHFCGTCASSLFHFNQTTQQLFLMSHTSVSVITEKEQIVLVYSWHRRTMPLVPSVWIVAWDAKNHFVFRVDNKVVVFWILPESDAIWKGRVPLQQITTSKAGLTILSGGGVLAM